MFERVKQLKPKLMPRPARAGLLCCSFLIGLSNYAQPSEQENLKPQSKPEADSKIVSSLSASEVHARVMFRHKNYLAALLAIGPEPTTLSGRWILAESLLNLGRFLEAEIQFEKIVLLSADKTEQVKAEISGFMAAIRSGDIARAESRYLAFKKQHKKAPSIMSYALAQVLYKSGQEEAAVKILAAVDAKSEFYLRARYLIAAAGVEKSKLASSVKLFNQIEKLKALTVEDYSVRQMAILAQARLYADAGREDLAQVAYERLEPSGPFADRAIIEILRIYLNKADQVATKNAAFAKISDKERYLSERVYIDKALAAISSYRKTQEIDWSKPELHTLMAQLFVRAKRYNEARLAYAELIDHYRSVQQKLIQSSQAQSETSAKPIWPYFSLDFGDQAAKGPEEPLVLGVPDFIIRNLLDLSSMLELKARIELSGRALKDLERQVEAGQTEPESLLKARQNQDLIVKEYEQLVLAKQNIITADLITSINSILTEADFKRAELALMEMRDVKKQINVAREFQTKKIQEFEANLKEYDPEKVNLEKVNLEKVNEEINLKEEDKGDSL